MGHYGPPVPQGPSPDVQKFGQRLAALGHLKGRTPFWIHNKDLHKLHGIDAMPHPDVDMNDLTS